jgi:hypothetical protein
MSNFGFITDIFRNIQGVYPWFIIFLCILLYYIREKNWKLIKIGIVFWVLILFNDIMGIYLAGIGSMRAGIFRFTWMMCAIPMIAVFFADQIWRRRKKFWMWMVCLAGVYMVSLFYSPESFYDGFGSYRNIYQINENIIEAVDLIIKDSNDENPMVLGNYSFLEKARLYNPAVFLLEDYYEAYKLTDSRYEPSYIEEGFPVLMDLCNGTLEYSWEDKKKALQNTDAEYIVVKWREESRECGNILKNEIEEIGKTEIYDVYKIKKMANEEEEI